MGCFLAGEAEAGLLGRYTVRSVLPGKVPLLSLSWTYRDIVLYLSLANHLSCKKGLTEQSARVKGGLKGNDPSL